MNYYYRDNELTKENVKKILDTEIAEIITGYGLICMEKGYQAGIDTILCFENKDPLYSKVQEELFGKYDEETRRKELLDKHEEEALKRSDYNNSVQYLRTLLDTTDILDYDRLTHLMEPLQKELELQNDYLNKER